MMKKTLSLWILLAFLLPLFGQEMVVENYESGVDVWLLVPYDIFRFSRDATLADYQVSIQIKDARNRQVAVNESELSVPNQDWLHGTAIPIHQSFELSAGKHSLNLTLRNRLLGDRHSFSRDFLVGTQITEIGQAYIMAERDGIKYIPEAALARDIDSLMLRLSFGLNPDKITLHLDEKRFDFIDPVSPFELDLMEYAITDSSSGLMLALTEQNIRYNLEPLYYNQWFSYNQRYSLKDQIDQLRYIASQNEWRVLSKVPKDRYADAIESFWRAHDPTPGTIRNENREYFYQRVIKADELFTIHRRMVGWKSDRGRIYIKFGEPDQIVNDSFPIGRAPSISWHYFRLNRVFVFEDNRGFGQFRLRNTEDEYLDL
jgi:GWxTD domain-containing protein